MFNEKETSFLLDILNKLNISAAAENAAEIVSIVQSIREKLTSKNSQT
jgi:hypothetical protein